VACPNLPYFSTLSQEEHNVKKKEKKGEKRKKERKHHIKELNTTCVF
jgi:hypothetical protein